MNKVEEKTIIKSNTILGGTKVLDIAVGIVRNKAVSILIGAAGMGTLALYQSTSDLISTIANLGTSTTAVKNISTAYVKDDIDKTSFVVTAFHKIVRLTGFFALLICILTSPILSYINFGDYSHIFDFFLLSISLFELQLVAGYTTLLQGCRKFVIMSKATLVGHILGLFICVPLYYFLRFNAIIPVLVVYPFVSYIVLKRFSKKLTLKSVRVSYSEAFKYGRDMIKTGFYICLQSLFSMLYLYILRLYLSNSGGLLIVGLFSAGMLLVNQYVGLVFTSMGTEYYPRLSTIDRMEDFVQAINMQIKRCMLILAPLISFMILCMPLVIRILYTVEFLPVVSFAIIMLASVGFKIIEWCIGFSFIAKGRTNVLFINEATFKIYLLILSVFLYNILGLFGIGVAYLIAEFCFSIQSIVVFKRLWHYSFNNQNMYTVGLNILLILICMSINLKYDGSIKILGTIIILIIQLIFLFNYLKSLR